ncbi:MAG: hypothetical protein BZ137_01480 [Methanosphaera sp. rholeuAM130]|nr:MAG: hypothetical protein BZ137_01480 [Methanosphaera sp. rholeuAM130]
MEVFIIRKFIQDIFNKGNFKDYFKRNKVFLLVSIFVLILSVYSGLTDPQSYAAFSNYSLNNLIMSNMEGSGAVGNFLMSFTATVLYYLSIIAMGLTFSVMAMLSFVANAVSIGFLFNQSISNIHLILPQSIFTLIASIFAMCGAFLVTKMEVRFIGYLSNHDKYPLNRLKAPFKDLILSIALMLIFVIIYSLLNVVLMPTSY